MSINYDDRIPNNVNLVDRCAAPARARDVAPALPGVVEVTIGPPVFRRTTIYLRTAISTEAGGWANFGYVHMPEYRWGIFLAAKEDGSDDPRRRPRRRARVGQACRASTGTR